MLAPCHSRLSRLAGGGGGKRGGGILSKPSKGKKGRGKAPDPSSQLEPLLRRGALLVSEHGRQDCVDSARTRGLQDTDTLRILLLRHLVAIF